MYITHQIWMCINNELHSSWVVCGSETVHACRAGRWMVGMFGPECLLLCENVSVADTVKQYLWVRDQVRLVNNVQTNLCVSEGQCLVLSLFLSLCVQYRLLQWLHPQEPPSSWVSCTRSGSCSINTHPAAAAGPGGAALSAPNRAAVRMCVSVSWGRFKLCLWGEPSLILPVSIHASKAQCSQSCDVSATKV